MQDGNKIATGTAEGLLDFLDFLVEKGYGTNAAIRPWKSAAKRILEVVEKTEDFGSVDVRSIDTAEYLDRFNTLAVGTMKQESVVTYGQRFEKAITAYVAYLDHKRLPSIRRIGSRPRPAPDPATEAAAGNGGNGNGHTAPSSLIDYPFPLQSNQVAHLRLPLRLERSDAERLAAFIRTLTFEPLLELTTGSGEDAG